MIPWAQMQPRLVFEFARIQSGYDWIVPGIIAVLVLLYAVYWYRRDTAELPLAWRYLLVGLRLVALLGLLIVYLQPQLRQEESVITRSRVVIAVDTSQSMGQTDPASAGSSSSATRLAQVAAFLDSSPLLKTLRQTHEVSVYQFDRDVHPLVILEYQGTDSTASKPSDGTSPDKTAETAPTNSDATGNIVPLQTKQPWSEWLAPRGSETALGKCLKEIIEGERMAPLSGVILFTDGRNNSGMEPGEAVKLAQEADLQIFPVGLGTDKQAPGIRVASLEAPPRASPRDGYVVNGEIQAHSLSGQIVQVELATKVVGAAASATDTEDWQLQQTHDVLIGADGERIPVRFELPPTSKLRPNWVGRLAHRIMVRPIADDPVQTDDSQEAEIEIVDRKTKVLLFAGAASKEYQFLRNQLRRDKDMELDVLLQTGAEGISQDAQRILATFPATPAELFAYDCVVAIDPDWRLLSDTQIEIVEKWIGNQAGGLIAVSGGVSTPEWSTDPRLTVIRDLYPVVFRQGAFADSIKTGSKTAYPLQLTEEGMRSEFLWIDSGAAASAKAWSEFEGVYSTYPVRDVKAGALVHMRVSNSGAMLDGKFPPYLASQFYGAGRVYWLASGEIWRLRGVKEAFFERFYTQAVRQAAQGRLLRGSRRGSLQTDHDQYGLGQTIDLRASLLDEQQNPLEQTEVSALVVLPDGTVQTVRLLADATRVGSFRGQLVARHEGMHRVELPVPKGDDERITSMFRVQLPDVERENSTRNDPLLSQIAQNTGGIYTVGIPGDGESTLAKSLRDRSRTEILASNPIPLWDNAWVLGGLCGMLCVEWLIRRLKKLA